MAQKVHTTIVISQDSAGAITLDAGSDDECQPSDKDSACGWTGFTVKWESDPKDLDWKVDFGQESPFKGGDTVFSKSGNKQGTVKEWNDLPTKSFPYEVSIGKERRTVTPKIVIQDSGGEMIPRS